ncbi:MAG: hypothetical protein ACOYM3_05310 [Terrimicrobiaceae bacterium]
MIQKAPADVGRLSARLASCLGILLLAACRPAPDSSPSQASEPQKPAVNHPATSVVSIPEEFSAPAATPTPEPPRVVLPRVVFATSDFQVTLNNGIQGIRAGEALNFLREEDGAYVVEYNGMPFAKNKSFFAATYVEPPRPEPTALPATEDVIPVAQTAIAASPEPPLPDEPPLSGTIPPGSAEVIPEQKMVGDLTDSIRKLNDQIRAAQEDLERKTTQSAAGGTPSARDLKKAAREIQKLKAVRDELSGQLTEVGKP